MKELFGVDITTSRKNEGADGLSYESKKIGAELSARMDMHNEAEEALANKASLPLALLIIKWLFGLFVVCVIIGTVRNIGKLSFGKMLSNAPWLYIIGAISAAAFIALWLYGRSRQRSTEGSFEFEASEEDAKRIVAEAERELGIPADADIIDGLIYRYKTKDGENKIPEQLYGHFIRSDVYVFAENGCFCICDSAVRFDVPLSSIEGIDIINKKFYLSGWDKEVMFNEEPYKEFTYKEADNLGRIWLRSVCAMRFRLQGDEFCFRFPTYELKTVERLCGVKAAEV